MRERARNDGRGCVDIGARVLRNTMALSAMERSDDRIAALRDMLCDLMHQGELRKQYFAMMSGLDVRYAFGDAHPLLGRRMSDLDLITALITAVRPKPVITGKGQTQADNLIQQPGLGRAVVAARTGL